MDAFSPHPLKHDRRIFTPCRFFRYNFHGRRLRIKNEPPNWRWGYVPFNYLVVDIHHELGFSIPKLDSGQVMVKISFFCFSFFIKLFFSSIFMDRWWFHLTDFRMLFSMPPTGWESIGKFFLWIFSWGGTISGFYPHAVSPHVTIYIRMKWMNCVNHVCFIIPNLTLDSIN